MERHRKGNDMTKEMTDKLAEYAKLCDQEWKIRDGKMEAKIELDKMCGKEQAQFKRAVNKIMKASRSGWSARCDCHVAIDHSDRPMKSHIVVSIDLLYSKGRRRGHIRLYGNYMEHDDILNELRCLVMQQKDS